MSDPRMTLESYIEAVKLEDGDQVSLEDKNLEQMLFSTPTSSRADMYTEIKQEAHPSRTITPETETELMDVMEVIDADRKGKFPLLPRTPRTPNTPATPTEGIRAISINSPNPDRPLCSSNRNGNIFSRRLDPIVESEIDFETSINILANLIKKDREKKKMSPEEFDAIHVHEVDLSCYNKEGTPVSILCMEDYPTLISGASWAEMFYYEAADRLGNAFKCPSKFNNMHVDGYSSVGEANRFSIGTIENIQRSPLSTIVRKQFGRGFGIVLHRDGQVIVTNEDESPVFIQCPLHAIEMGDSPSTVYRIGKEQKLVIFNEKFYDHMLVRCFKEDFRHVYLMQTLCNIRISLVKGWGTNYSRKKVTSAPVWLNFQFLNVLRKLDMVLGRMDRARFLVVDDLKENQED